MSWKGVKYYSSVTVTELTEDDSHAFLKICWWKTFYYSYSYEQCLRTFDESFFLKVSNYWAFQGSDHHSAPLKHNFLVKGPHSFDHGYEYALVTPDNRLMIGGCATM